MSITYYVLCREALPEPVSFCREQLGSAPEEIGLWLEDTGRWEGALDDTIALSEQVPKPWLLELGRRHRPGASFITAVSMSGPSAAAEWELTLFELAPALADFTSGIVVNESGELVYGDGSNAGERKVVNRERSTRSSAPIPPSDARTGSTAHPSEVDLAQWVDRLVAGEETPLRELRAWANDYTWKRALANRIFEGNRRAVGDALVAALRGCPRESFDRVLEAIVLFEYAEGIPRICRSLEQRGFFAELNRALPALHAVKAKQRLDKENDWSDV